MSEAWNRVRRRHQLAEAVLNDVGATGPTAIAGWRSQIDAEYGDDDLSGFLQDVQARWNRTFDARLDAALELGSDGVRQAMDEVWRTVAQSQPQTRLLLHAYADHPCLAAGDLRHRRMVLATTGIDFSTMPQRAAARAEARPPRDSLIGRLRHRHAERRRACNRRPAPAGSHA